MSDSTGYPPATAAPRVEAMGRGWTPDPPPRRWSTWIVAVVVAASVLSLVGVAATVWWVASGGLHGCTQRDRNLASTLTELEVLDLRPSGATRRGAGYSGCDGDDGFAYAGQSYRPGARVNVIDFYRTAAPEQGWALHSENANPVPAEGLVVSAARLCFTKTVDGVTGYLSIWFPRDFGAKTRDYGVEVTASHDGAASC
ncbi:MAG: hypothetical protein ACRDQ2_02195 [Gaiellales bacterium]